MKTITEEHSFNTTIVKSEALEKTAVGQLVEESKYERVEQKELATRMDHQGIYEQQELRVDMSTEEIDKELFKYQNEIGRLLKGFDIDDIDLRDFGGSTFEREEVPP